MIKTTAGHRTAIFLVINAVLLSLTVLFSGSASAAPTQGLSGGFTDRTFQTYTGTSGVSSQYHLYAGGLSRTAPLCVVLQFHGDGAYEFWNPTSTYSLGGPDGVVANSRERGCLTVSVLTPDKRGALTWWENGATNADYVRDLVDGIRDSYNLDSQRIWLIGYSGGAQFITKFFLPLHSDAIDGGGSVLFGGGGTPARGIEQPYAPGMKSRFHLTWYTGADDDGFGRVGGFNALRNAREGEAHFKSLGFTTSHQYPASTAHALNGRFGAILGQRFDLAN